MYFVDSHWLYRWFGILKSPFLLFFWLQRDWNWEIGAAWKPPTELMLPHLDSASNVPASLWTRHRHPAPCAGWRQLWTGAFSTLPTLAECVPWLQLHRFEGQRLIALRLYSSLLELNTYSVRASRNTRLFAFVAVQYKFEGLVLIFVSAEDKRKWKEPCNRRCNPHARKS